LILWETQCLASSMGDVMSDDKDDMGYLEDPDDVEDKGDPFEQLERWAAYYFKFFEKTDIRPFIESIQNREALTLLDHNFSPFMGGFIAFLSFILVNLIILCIFTFVKKLSKKMMKKRNCCLKICAGILGIFTIVIFALVITNFVWTKKMYRIEEKLLCEATRIPHALFFGNPEIHFEIEKSEHFIGLERIRSYMTTFLNESNSYTKGYNLKTLQEIESANILNTVNALENSLDVFYAKYDGMTGRDASGRNRVPMSVSYSIPFYKTHMTSLIEKYKIAALHLHKISEFSTIMKNPQYSESFIRYLKDSHEVLIDIQVRFSKFWNSIMDTSFDSTLAFKISVIGVIVLTTLISIATITSLFVFYKSVKSGKMKNKSNVRCLLILIIFIAFWSVLGILEVGRGVFTSFYGCSVMYQLDKDPYNTRDKILPYLLDDPEVSKVFEHCYFQPEPHSPKNFYNLLESSGEKDSTANFLSFLDGIKLIHEDVQIMDKDQDIYYTDRLVEALESFKTGESLDFDDVFNKLGILNYNFDCSHIYYSLTDKECENLPGGKTTCIRIDTGSFTTDQCMEDKIGESAPIFDNLKEYITREKIFIDNILEDVNGATNDSSLVNMIHSTIEKFEIIDGTVRNLNSNLATNFDSMVKGPIEDWLNCGIIRDELKKTFNSMCNHDTETMMKFGDLNFFIIFISLIMTNILFVISCCFVERGKKR